MISCDTVILWSLWVKFNVGRILMSFKEWTFAYLLLAFQKLFNFIEIVAMNNEILLCFLLWCTTKFDFNNFDFLLLFLIDLLLFSFILLYTFDYNGKKLSAYAARFEFQSGTFNVYSSTDFV